MPAPAVINRLPLVSNLLKWFKGDELTIDNALFKLHHQVKTKHSRLANSHKTYSQHKSSKGQLLPLFEFGVKT